eukprot:scaffold99467_cov21-Prasinocladus_malaysianus.AAC.1
MGYAWHGSGETFSYWQTPSSLGVRSEGVPEKAMRYPNTRSPPSSCPLADSLEAWLGSFAIHV